jgi:hypothetical protein
MEKPYLLEGIGLARYLRRGRKTYEGFEVLAFIYLHGSIEDIWHY